MPPIDVYVTSRINERTGNIVTLEGRTLPLFPCYANKRPACANGFRDASADPDRVAALWAGRSGLLVAVPTGPQSGIAVLDLDPPLARRGGPAPDTAASDAQGPPLHLRVAAGAAMQPGRDRAGRRCQG
jgi:bifunctional DNA primase/polymerase-like protein